MPCLFTIIFQLIAVWQRLSWPMSGDDPLNPFFIELDELDTFFWWWNSPRMPHVLLVTGQCPRGYDTHLFMGKVGLNGELLQHLWHNWHPPLWLGHYGHQPRGHPGSRFTAAGAIGSILGGGFNGIGEDSIYGLIWDIWLVKLILVDNIW